MLKKFSIETQHFLIYILFNDNKITKLVTFLRMGVLLQYLVLGQLFLEFRLTNF